MRTLIRNNKKLVISNKYIWKGKYITSISITGQPTKKSYWVGDNIDLSGMTVVARYSDGTTVQIPTSDLYVTQKVSKFDDSIPVDVFYNGFKTQFSVSSYMRPQKYVGQYSTMTPTGDRYWMINNSSTVFQWSKSSGSYYAMTRTRLTSQINMKRIDPYNEINGTTFTCKPTNISFNISGNICYVVELARDTAASTGSMLFAPDVNIDFCCMSGTWTDSSRTHTSSYVYGKGIIVAKDPFELMEQYNTGDLGKMIAIDIVNPPTKTDYKLNDTITIAGIQVDGVNYNGSRESIPSSNLTYTPTKATAAGSSYVTVSYNGLSSKYNIFTKVGPTRKITSYISGQAWFGEPPRAIGRSGAQITTTKQVNYALVKDNSYTSTTLHCYYNQSDLMEFGNIEFTGTYITSGGIKHKVMKLTMITSGFKATRYIDTSDEYQFAQDNGYIICEESIDQLRVKYEDI